MIKSFAALGLLLILISFSIGLHYLFFPYEKAESSMKQMTALMHRAPLSLSVAYDESNYNSTYPEMQGLGRMDFVYER